ncbi:hypothetical protein Gorai_021884 [Gossypium raimondii]|uniref:Zinc knuckle CX2CX4HX4C domain-containing protein n=1 Tax=Gossypium raimondii TaxID=29730 RepID=A0A7J8NS18_GOSRA|nr:hypothetical protein [Gossypium raimondii]
MEADFAGLTLNEEEEAILQIQLNPIPKKEEGAFRRVGCFLTATVIHFPAMKSIMVNLWHPIRGVQILDLGGKRVQFDVRRPLKRKKQVMFFGNCSYVRFKYERLTLFCFYCGRLGHSDSFCEEKIALGVEIAEMGWDISLQAQSRRSQALSSA